MIDPYNLEPGQLVEVKGLQGTWIFKKMKRSKANGNLNAWFINTESGHNGMCGVEWLKEYGELV